MNNKNILSEPIKVLDKDLALEYLFAYQANHIPVEELIEDLFVLIEKKDKKTLIYNMMETSYKIKVINKSTGNQIKKKTYENSTKFLNFGKTLWERHHNIKTYQKIEMFCEIYRIKDGKWEKIENTFF